MESGHDSTQHWKVNLSQILPNPHPGLTEDALTRLWLLVRWPWWGQAGMEKVGFSGKEQSRADMGRPSEFPCTTLFLLLFLRFAPFWLLSLLSSSSLTLWRASMCLWHSPRHLSGTPHRAHHQCGMHGTELPSRWSTISLPRAASGHPSTRWARHPH